MISTSVRRSVYFRKGLLYSRQTHTPGGRSSHDASEARGRCVYGRLPALSGGSCCLAENPVQRTEAWSVWIFQRRPRLGHHRSTYRHWSSQGNSWSHLGRYDRDCAQCWGCQQSSSLQISAAVRIGRRRFPQRYVDKLLICMALSCKSIYFPANDNRAWIVKENKIWFSINSPPGAAAGAKAGIQYTCMASRGAVLVARPPVSCARLITESDLITWVHDNIEALVHKGHWPSIKKRGLWVIRKTYQGPECAKSVFQATDENVTLHVGAKVPNMGDATASAGWWNVEHVGSGWTIQRVSPTFYHAHSNWFEQTIPLCLRWFTSIGVICVLTISRRKINPWRRVKKVLSLSKKTPQCGIKSPISSGWGRTS